MAKILNIKDNVPWLIDTDIHDTTALLNEQQFNSALYRERKRVERNGECMFLLLVDVTNICEERSENINKISESLLDEIRDTDACGWLKENEVLSIIFTEIPVSLAEKSAQKIETKIKNKLSRNLSQSLINQLNIEVIVFPDTKGTCEGTDVINSDNEIFYPEIFKNHRSTRWSNSIKRIVDVIGSFFALILFSPIFMIVPILIKLTSPGPVFFRQERVGLQGKKFSFLKFRSMHVNNDDSIHRNFIKGYIDNKMDDLNEVNGNPIFKIKNDPRLTPIGNFLRKSSIDEFPQFINVIKGEMSLVGPRPPIPYEVANYSIWHWYRIMAKKPGITGLWQVYGRSLTTFDGMVRLDLEYIRKWSLWLDFKLLVATPMAVLRGKGAY